MEEARERLNKIIDKYGLRSIEALRVSQKLDKYVIKSMKGEIK